jgi:shikimate dehydrogenase
MIDDSAKYTGAVNTVVNKDGKLIGYNTDGQGYIQNLLAHGIELKGKKSYTSRIRRCGNTNCD